MQFHQFIVFIVCSTAVFFHLLPQGMINATRAVGAVLLFMVLLMYIFAIVLTVLPCMPLCQMPEVLQQLVK